MKLVKISTPLDKEHSVVINCDHIVCLHKDSEHVTLKMSNGHDVRTIFSNVESAVDFLNRAASYSPTPQYEGPQ